MAEFRCVLPLLVGLVRASQDQCSLLQFHSSNEHKTQGPWLDAMGAKDGAPYRVIKDVGSCRSSKEVVLWNDWVHKAGNKSAADCWYGCKDSHEYRRSDNIFPSFVSDANLTACICMEECKCMVAGQTGFIHIIVSSEFSGRLPPECTDCPRLEGTYKYSRPGETSGKLVHLKQKGCLGIVSGQEVGRFVTAVDNKGTAGLFMKTVHGGLESYGHVYGGKGSHVIHWDDGTTYTATLSQTPEWWQNLFSEIDGWDFLWHSTCTAGRRLWRTNTIPSKNGGHGHSSPTECAEYAKANDATYFSYSACQPPHDHIQNYVIEAQGCGASGCLNNNKGYSSFREAWRACGIVDGCAHIMRWPNGKYYHRRLTDPLFQRRRYLRKSNIGVAFHCPQQWKHCAIWNTCTNIEEDLLFSVYQKACPSINEICNGTAECSLGCTCPLCAPPPMPG